MKIEFNIEKDDVLHIRYMYCKECRNYQFDAPCAMKIEACKAKGEKFFSAVFEAINPGEYAQIKSWVAETIHSIYEYKNSAAGILDIISTDYKDTTFDMEQLTNDIQNPETLGLLKDVLTKLG